MLRYGGPQTQLFRPSTVISNLQVQRYGNIEEATKRIPNKTRIGRIFGKIRKLNPFLSKDDHHSFVTLHDHEVCLKEAKEVLNKCGL